MPYRWQTGIIRNVPPDINTSFWEGVNDAYYWLRSCSSIVYLSNRRLSARAAGCAHRPASAPRAARAEEAKRREALAQVPTGVAAVDEDLGVAKALVAAARSGAANKQAEKTTAALGRMKPTLRTLRAEVPAAVMAQHLERALVAISSLPASEAVKAASSSLLAAIDIAMQAPAPLVPEVVDRIKAAKDKVDAEQLQPAADQILEILADLRDDATGKLLDSASGSMRGAQDALCREAWPVLIAELDQLEAILSQLQEKVGQETTVIAGEQEPTVTEGARVAGGEEKPAAEPGAETTTGAPEARPPAPE